MLTREVLLRQPSVSSPPPAAVAAAAATATSPSPSSRARRRVRLRSVAAPRRRSPRRPRRRRRRRGEPRRAIPAGAQAVHFLARRRRLRRRDRRGVLRAPRLDLRRAVLRGVVHPSVRDPVRLERTAPAPPPAAPPDAAAAAGESLRRPRVAPDASNLRELVERVVVLVLVLRVEREPSRRANRRAVDVEVELARGRRRRVERGAFPTNEPAAVEFERRSVGVERVCDFLIRAVLYERKSGWSSKASGGVERRRGRGLKARDGRRDTPGKVLKDRRS